ncbi:MAG: hypothetical protein WAN46_11810 [Gammaproteobacteria bacterium]
MQETTERRRFIYRTGQLIAGGLLGSTLLNAQAAGASASSDDFYEMDASTEGKCATCEFWGGVRRLTEDRRQVWVQSLGWCNNPTSHRYQQLTTPETGPMESWKKWGALA